MRRLTYGTREPAFTPKPNRKKYRTEAYKGSGRVLFEKPWKGDLFVGGPDPSFDSSVGAACFLQVAPTKLFSDKKPLFYKQVVRTCPCEGRGDFANTP